MPLTDRADSDRFLVERFLRHRDEAAFRLLFRAHTPALLQLARRLLGGADGADDVVQEAWLRAARGLAGFAWRSSLRTWLCGIVVRCWQERRRAQRPTAELADEVMGTPPPLVERLDLERAIAALPDGYRAVLLLHDVEGWTHDAIAAELGVEVGTSKSQLSRARRALRAWWVGARPRPETAHG